jgi:FkbM family methyltransferase
MLYRATDSVIGLLRAHVKRDSRLWKGLSLIRRACSRFRDNPINRRRWKSNYRKFESIIEQHSQTTHDFFVLQIGACDGVQCDPIHEWIKKYRWRGILVEPQTNEFERLKSNYKDNDNLRFENVAIAEENGLRCLYKVKEDSIVEDWQRGIASFIPKPHLERQDKITTEMVQCVRFDILLDKHDVNHIDLLQIDVEGYDYEILKMFDFNRIKPQLIRYEHAHLKLSDKASCKKYLTHNGYRILEMEDDTGAILQSY